MCDTTTIAVERLANIYDAGGLDRELAATIRALAAERDSFKEASMRATAKAVNLTWRESDRNRQASEDYLALVAVLDELMAERDRLREALTFYADISDYPAPLTGGMGKLYFDCGQTARAALDATNA